MEARNSAVIRAILQNPDTGKTLLVAVDKEDFRYRSDGFTGKQQPVKLREWIELHGSDQFIMQGVEITDGVLSKTFAPIPDHSFYFWRFLSHSGKVVFALEEEDEVYVNVLTETPLSESELHEFYTMDPFYPVDFPRDPYFPELYYVELEKTETNEDEIEEEDEDEENEKERETFPKKPVVTQPLGKYGSLECECGTVTHLSSIDRNVYCSGCGRLIFDLSKSKQSSSNSAPITPQEHERYQPQGGKWRLGRDIQTGEYVDAPQAGRREGLYIIGLPGTGKTGLIENLIIQDIKQGMGVGLLDPHGDLTQAVLARLPERREQDVIYLDITDEDYPFGLNLFTCDDPNSAKAVQVVVDKVMHVFDKIFDLSAATTPRLRQYLRNCTQTLIVNPGYTMADMPLLLLDEQCRKQLIANVINTQVQSFWKTFSRMKPSEQLDHADSTLNKLDELLQPLTVNIVGQSTSSVDVRKIMDEGKILLVKLSAQLDSVTSLIGSVLIALFLNAAYARPANKRRQFNLYADEFQRFSTDDFATLLTEARKFGIATTIAHQARYQPGMTDGIRATSLSAKNLVVFKVNSKDADELAGEFDITPQEAWEEVLEEEWVEIVKPQWHERIEEQVEVEVEEDIEEITQNPLEYLKSARGTHIHAKVRSSMLAILPQLRIDHTIPPQYRNEKTPDNLLFINTLLVDVMEHRLAVQTEEFAERVAEFVIVAAMDIGWMSRFSYAGLKLHRYSPSQSSAVKNFRELLSRCIYEYVSVTIDEKRLSEELACLTQELKGIEPLEIAQLSSFITNLIVLCKGLAEEPLRVPTGKKRLVKRIEPRITYLTHESEKITHPRKTIMHPQRTYADMHNEVAAQLVNLGNFLARIRYINADQRNVECAIRTLDPKQDADTRPLFVSALEERIACIKARNMQDGYLRKRMDVEAEIRQRQELCCEPPDEPSDTIYRRPKH